MARNMAPRNPTPRSDPPSEAALRAALDHDGYAVIRALVDPSRASLLHPCTTARPTGFVPP